MNVKQRVQFNKKKMKWTNELYENLNSVFMFSSELCLLDFRFYRPRAAAIEPFSPYGRCSIERRMARPDAALSDPRSNCPTPLFQFGP